jgi:hypothetical protein
MANFSQTYTSNTAITIPAFAESISVSVAAARGGTGGNDDVYAGGTGGPGRFGSFTLPDNNASTRTLTLNIGRIGANGPTGATAGGGAGGSGVASGGRGGNSGPQGSSGAGGGGGGASGVFDSISNSWIIVAGGGGGGGGAAFPNVPGLNGGAGLGWSASVAAITNGGAGGNCPSDGSGGGGGGGGASGGGGGANGFDVSAGNVRAQGGGGGGSGYRSTACTWTGETSINSGNGFIAISYIVDPPTVAFSVSPTSIIRGETATLSWNVTGNISSVSINQGVGSVGSSGTRSVSPQSTTTYTITATGIGGTTIQSITLTVYQPPETLLTLDNPTIIRGQCTFLRWITTGDAGSATITPGIGAVNINGNRQICPTETTTYIINVSGLGGTDSDSITLIVYQPPTVDLSGPESLNYGQQGTLTYQATDADISLQITLFYVYKNGVVQGNEVNLPIGASVNGTVTTVIPYNDFGPVSATYIITATGNGGEETKFIVVPINIDETPENFLVPESEDLLKGQNPIYTPDSLVTSYEILINDIDIPVEIKADRPILVDINNQEIWNSIREI